MRVPSRIQFAAHPRTPLSPFTVTLKLWRHLTLASLTALVFTACGSGTTLPAVQDSGVTPGHASSPTPGEVPMLGLTELEFAAATNPSASAARTVVYQTGALRVTRTAGELTQTGGARLIRNTYEVENTGDVPLHNLTFVAVHRAADNVAGTAISAMRASADQPLSLPEAARGLLPASGVATADGSSDFQGFTAVEAQALTASAQAAGTLEAPDDVLGYGFVVQAPGGARTLAPGERGEVHVAFVLPDTPAGVSPLAFSASFLLTQDAVTRVTQLDGESLDSAVGRAGQPVNADRLITLSGVGSSVGSSAAVTGMKVVPVPALRTFATPKGTLYGVIQAQGSRLGSDYQAGLRVRTLELAWDRYELTEGGWDEAYLSSKRSEYLANVRAGFEVVLDLGVQYPPGWLLKLPDSRFVDQHGSVYRSQDPGANPVNAVFNRAVRAYQARYVTQVFRELGSAFYGVRLGWGRYGELGFPLVDAGANSYWAFDALAQGERPGLPDGVRADPVPGWQPLTGRRTPTDGDRAAARSFVSWYLDSLNNYHDWQIGLVRGLYAGRLFMLYPSFGLRPGQLDQAVAGGLGGLTSPEINTELQRGFDFARYIGGLKDPLVSPYTTWLDADGLFVDDAGQNPAGWSPAHYFSVLAAANPAKPQVWGENTGRNTLSDLQRCVNRVRAYRLGGMFWAFNADLYDSVHASIGEYRSLIASQP
ncbi:hypothetical protein [Deinococcus sp.]|uniref:hypothetical protein n=1 Tax=Deinococcus sp. TaxID=47478 RepID=UPI003C7E64AC